MMRRIGIALLIICASYIGAQSDNGARATATITLVNGTSRDVHVAPALDYTQYVIPGIGGNYMTMGPSSSYDVSPWLTGDWKRVKAGATEHIELSDGSYCPEYLVFKDRCSLHSDRFTRFEDHYDAIALVDEPHKLGTKGTYTCSGNVTVTLAEHNQQSTNDDGCAIDVTVSHSLKPHT